MLETEEMSERDLPPEIVRRLQVEELWARRLVLAGLMNAERLRLYNRRRAEVLPASFAPVDVAWKKQHARHVASIVPIKAKKALMPGA
jgi:hypothetical protein